MPITKFKQHLRDKILSYKPNFNLEILNIGLNEFQVSDYKAGDYLVKAGESCKHVFIAEKSISRCYFLGEDGEGKTLWLEPEMSFITDYESFNSQVLSNCNIHIYEDSLICHIDRESLSNLYIDYHDWAQVGIAIIENHFINLFKITTTIHFNDASKNYELLEKSFSKYLEVVPLKHLAFWFNISAVHLSRIRAERFKINAN